MLVIVLIIALLAAIFIPPFGYAIINSKLRKLGLCMDNNHNTIFNPVTKEVVKTDKNISIITERIGMIKIPITTFKELDVNEQCKYIEYYNCNNDNNKSKTKDGTMPVELIINGIKYVRDQK